ncbi:peptidoglycan recognition protein [Streptomyces sp. NPDC006879]|uniref:peptidoglycan recognition protein family protein n=1 Tax=Streptomyces sp. NPDC006879 TaxID=3364767 RepID=UPI00367F7207
MRGFLASSIGVVCTAALALPLACASPVMAAPAAPAKPAASVSPHGSAVRGTTQSLPLVPLSPLVGPIRGMAATPGGGHLAAPDIQGLPARDVETFSMVGVVWDDAASELHGQVHVRTRDAESGGWSPWQELQTHNREHAADPDDVERASGRVRGSTAPLWVGPSDAVEVRVEAEAEAEAADQTGPGRLPSGMRIELIDPGESPVPEPPAGGDPAGTPPPAGDPADDSKNQASNAALGMAAAEASAANFPLATLGADAIQPLNKADATADAVFAADGSVTFGAKPYIGPRPRIITRKGWGADEKLRESSFLYTGSVKAAFVHHSATGNNYTCAQAPAVIRSIYRYHVVSSGWRDIGYNFLVDKCGNIYEGRAGGVAKAVQGAHTLGFNSNSMGVVVLGTYTSTSPSAAATTSVAKLTAWKLGLFGANPAAKTTLVSAGGGRYAKGKSVKMNVISGHRDGFATECPGTRLYGKLGATRTSSAKLQGR